MGCLVGCLGLLSLVTAGCGDTALSSDSSTAGDLHAPSDLGSPANVDLALDMTIANVIDLAPSIDMSVAPDLVTSFGVGMECPNGNECAPGTLCLSSKLDPSLPARGYCTFGCMSDPDCGANAFCGPPIGNAGSNVCWLRCGPNNTCADPNQVCSRHLDGYLDLVNPACIPGSAAAVEGSPCTTFGDCNKNQTCVNNPFDAKNGECLTLGCTVGDQTTCIPGNSAQCLPIAPGITACVPGCTTNNDCRTADSFSCAALIGQGQPMECVYPHATAGAACTKDIDCGPANSPWKCLVSNNFPGNYCTGITCDPTKPATCPDNSICIVLANNMGSFCGATCTTNNDCRMGYTCKAYDPNKPTQLSCLP